MKVVVFMKMSSPDSFMRARCAASKLECAGGSSPYLSSMQGRLYVFKGPGANSTPRLPINIFLFK
jgi:hypothetical protein